MYLPLCKRNARDSFHAQQVERVLQKHFQPHPPTPLSKRYSKMHVSVSPFRLISFIILIIQIIYTHQTLRTALSNKLSTDEIPSPFGSHERTCGANQHIQK